MAIESTDYLAIYQTTSGEIRKATVGALLSSPSAAPDLQAVTEKGNTTTEDIELTGNFVCGQRIFGGAAVTNVGTEIHPTKGAVHIRPANDTDIAALEVLGHDTAKSHYKVHGDGKLEIGNNVASGDVGATIHPDGASTFNGSAKFNSGIRIASTVGFGAAIDSYGTGASYHRGDFKFGGTQSSDATISLNADGSIEAVSIDGGEYS